MLPLCSAVRVRVPALVPGEGQAGRSHRGHEIDCSQEQKMAAGGSFARIQVSSPTLRRSSKSGRATAIETESGDDNEQTALEFQ